MIAKDPKKPGLNRIKPIIERSNAKSKQTRITFYTQVKTALKCPGPGPLNTTEDERWYVLIRYSNSKWLGRDSSAEYACNNLYNKPRANAQMLRKYLDQYYWHIFIFNYYFYRLCCGFGCHFVCTLIIVCQIFLPDYSEYIVNFFFRIGYYFCSTMHC